MNMNLPLLLEMYRRNSVPFTKQAAADLARLAPAAQTELLLYMLMDHITASQDQEGVVPDVAGTA
jgi:hypothetical protein